jgi:drug/metabolite transporter (DMT)-like permease
MTDLGRVIAWMGGALVSFCALALAIRGLSVSLSVYEVLTLRSLGGVAILGVYGVARGGIAWPRPLHLHVLRNVVHCAAQICWAWGVILLPLATVFALEFTTPAWTMVLAVAFLGERLTLGRVAAVALGFVGVLIILRPGLGSFDMRALLVLAAAVMFAVQLTTTKFLTGTNSVLTILFWMNVMQLPMNYAAHVAIDRQMAIWTGLDWSLAPVAGVLLIAGLAAHVCLTNAFRFGDATLVVPLDFLRVPLIALIGAAFYAEPIDVLVLVGAAVTATGILWSLREHRAAAH